MSGYRRVQTGHIHLILLGFALLMIGSAIFLRASVEPADIAEKALGATVLFAASGLFVLLSFSFMRLTISDGGDHLKVAFGPIPLLWRRVPYADITAVQPARSALLDGWGVHYFPGRGWTWNLWGFDCVELTLDGRRTLRLGTDDPQGLRDFLQQRMQG